MPSVADEALTAPAPVLYRPRRARVGNRKLTLAAFVFAIAALAAVVVAGVLVTDAATVTDFSQKNLAPSLGHPFGTDWMGRDISRRARRYRRPACWVSLFFSGGRVVGHRARHGRGGGAGRGADAAARLIDLD